MSDEEPTILKKEIDITKEKVSYLDLSLRLRLLLRLNGIKSIGDLVNSDYETLSKLGSKNLKILRDLIHGEGCLFIDDEPYILDMRNYNLEDMLDMINSDSKVSLGETKETELNRYKQVNKEIKLDIKDGLETIRGMYGVIGENECLNEMKKVVDEMVNNIDGVKKLSLKK